MKLSNNYNLKPKTCVYVFGNEDLEMDSLPLKMLPELQRRLPEVKFIVQDPNEDWGAPENLIILDTTIGIEKITIFDSLDKFAPAPRVSMHDFDALTNLRYLQKLGKIKSVKIIAVPATKNTTLSELTDSVALTLSFLQSAQSAPDTSS